MLIIHLGCIDGKHVRIKKPSNSGSLYYNYQGFFSIVLMAVCDANYRILYMDCGAYGHNNDAGIFERSAFLRELRSGSLSLPDAEPLPNSNIEMPYFFVGDSAFPLATYMMKPFPIDVDDREKTVYNYRSVHC